MGEYKQLNLFGENIDAGKPINRKRRDEVFTNYGGFIDKFKTKKTTDDCYTPKPVYDAIVSWVFEQWPELSDAPVVRPFYPGGDYETYEYPEGCIVIDNPPSIVYPSSCLARL